MNNTSAHPPTPTQRTREAAPPPAPHSPLLCYGRESASDPWAAQVAAAVALTASVTGDSATAAALLSPYRAPYYAAPPPSPSPLVHEAEPMLNHVVPLRSPLRRSFVSPEDL